MAAATFALAAASPPLSPSGTFVLFFPAEPGEAPPAESLGDGGAPADTRGVGAFPGTSADVLGDAEPHDTLVPLVPVAIPGGRRFGSRLESSPGAKSKRLLADRGRPEPDPPLIGVSYASFAAPDMDGPAAEESTRTGAVSVSVKPEVSASAAARSAAAFAACCLLSTLMLLRNSRKPPRFLSRGSSAPPPSPSSGAIGGSPARS